MWWDTERIEATVTRQFVCSHLYAEEVAALEHPLAFGGGLTDGTYWEWIEEKAKRIFLILVDLGCPNQIFALIDDSWEDDDLPIALDQIGRLAIAGAKDERFDRKFYAQQFHYIVRYLEPGSHIVYQEDEVIPLIVADRRPGLNSNSAVDRVELPNRPDEVLSRRRIPLGHGAGLFSYEEFLYEVNRTKNIQNGHLVSYYGSYTHRGFGYTLFTPASDFNLKSLLVTLPAPLKPLDKQVRRNLVMNWIHCLVDALCYIHSRGHSHGNIKPSSVLFNAKHNVFYTDLTRLSGEALALASDTSAFDKESYDYAAPEQWYRPPTTFASSRTTTSLLSPTLPPENARFSISRGGHNNHESSAVVGSSNTSSSRTPTTTTTMTTTTPSLNPQAADIFSLGCVILELLGFQLKRPTKTFAAHRAAKHKTPGRGGAVLDSSFHQNVGQVESWMRGLAKDAEGRIKKDKGQVFKGVVPMLQVVARMLAVSPQDRPRAHEVERSMYRILTECCEMAEPHCVHQYYVELSGDMGMGGLRIREEDEDEEIEETETGYVVGPPGSRPLSTSVRSEPHISNTRNSYRRSGGSGSGDDRETIVSYGGHSDPGAGAQQQQQYLSPQTWQHPHPGVYRGSVLSTQSGTME